MVAKLYPNPSNGFITVEFAKEANVSSIQIFDATGRVVLSESVIEGSIRKSLDLTGMAEGVYGIRVNSDKQTSTAQFVIQK